MTQKINLNISGMDCASCAAVIEHNLKKTKGVFVCERCVECFVNENV